MRLESQKIKIKILLGKMSGEKAWEYFYSWSFPSSPSLFLSSTLSTTEQSMRGQVGRWRNGRVRLWNSPSRPWASIYWVTEWMNEWTGASRLACIDCLPGLEELIPQKEHKRHFAGPTFATACGRGEVRDSGTKCSRIALCLPYPVLGQFLRTLPHCCHYPVANFFYFPFLFPP